MGRIVRIGRRSVPVGDGQAEIARLNVFESHLWRVGDVVNDGADRPSDAFLIEDSLQGLQQGTA